MRFADDVALIAENLKDVESCLDDLSVASSARGLRINMEETKILCNPHATQAIVRIGGKVIEEVDSYVYLGQRISLQSKGMNSEVNRRIHAV